MSNWKAEIERRGVDDMTLLSKISEDGILQNLQKRYGNDDIFTYIGEVLISVNPYKALPCCDGALIPKYKGKNRLEMPPNVFALADDTYRTMLNEAQNQCVIISGESGAGKTEASKLIMKYIAAVSGNSAGVEQVKSVILESNPLLEAFGNAKTVRNNNSSRFGKYFEIQFNALGDPDGGKITNYLLEKSRVTFQNQQERNFHVFYQMLSGASNEEKQYYQLWKPSDYTYLNQSGCERVDGVDDAEDWREMRNAMTVIGIDGTTQSSIVQLLAAILHLGNVTFVENAQGEASIYDPGQLAIAAQMFGVEPFLLETKLMSRIMTTGIGGRGSVYNVPLNQVQATYGRDALAQVCYSRMFDYLVQAVNAAMAKTAESLVIGVLDIYGFEIFQKNGFEQFCINYVNEKLQQIFIELTLKAEQEEYVREGISWTPIDYFNNKVVCDLIESKRPPGIFCVLDDICATIHGQSDGVDEKFVQKLDGSVSGHAHYISRHPCFVVKHYAGDVLYNCDGFTDRNKDAITKEMLEIIKMSNDNFLQTIFPEPIPSADDKKKNNMTAGKRIVASAGELVTALMACTPHYIRCIKPNETKKPRDFEQARVLHQVRYLGLLENVRIRRAGFAYRQKFDRFLYRFAILSSRTWPRWNGSDVEGCNAIIADARVPRDQVQMGTTKVFLRLPETLFTLEEERDRRFHDCALHIQRAYKFWKAQKFYNDLKMSQIPIFGGRKERRRNSLDREFLGDYLGFRDNYLLHDCVRAAGGDPDRERVAFADHVDKFDRRFKLQKRQIIISDQAIYIIGIEQVKKGPQKGEWVYEVKRRISLRSVRGVALSQMADDFVIIQINGEYDNVFACKRKTELVCVLNLQMNQMGCRMDCQFGNQLQYVIKEGAGQRILEFRPDQQGQPDYVAKGSGKKLIVTVPRGLDPNSQPTSTYTPPDPSKKRRYGDGQGEYRPGAGRDELDPRAAFQARNQAAGGLVKKAPAGQPQRGGGGQPQRGGARGGGQRGGGGGGPAQAAPPMMGAPRGGAQRGGGGPAQGGGPRGGGGQPRGGAAPARGGGAPRGGGGGGGGGGGPRCKALYDYDAEDADELSFRAGDVIDVLESSEGWWKGTLNGQTGIFPGNYVEMMAGGGGGGGPRGGGAPRGGGGQRGAGIPMGGPRGRGRG